MRRVLLECFMLVSLFSLHACIPEKNEVPDSEVLSEENVQEEDGGGIALGEDESEKIPEYQMLSMKEAQKIFEKAGDYIILDVREVEEFSISMMWYTTSGSLSANLIPSFAWVCTI